MNTVSCQRALRRGVFKRIELSSILVVSLLNCDLCGKGLKMSTGQSTLKNDDKALMMRMGAALLMTLTVTMLLATKVARTIVMRKHNLSNGTITLKIEPTKKQERKMDVDDQNDAIDNYYSGSLIKDLNFVLQVAEYKGEYYRQHPVIQSFWEVFFEFPIDMKKKFLGMLEVEIH